MFFFLLLRPNYHFDFLTVSDCCKHSDDDLNMSDQFNDWNINLLLILNACFVFLKPFLHMCSQGFQCFCFPFGYLD